MLEKYLGIEDDDKKAKDIIKEAFKQIGLNGQGKKKQKERDILCASIAGYDNKDNPHELIAHSFDRNYSGKGNEFTRTVESIIVKRINTK